MSKTNDDSSDESGCSGIGKRQIKLDDDDTNNLKRPACRNPRGETRERKQPCLSNEDEADNENKNGIEANDVAQELGLKAGDRLEVKWEITDEASGQVRSHWWGATLMHYDGRTSDDGLAIRVLDYDPYPEGGFLQRSFEDVFFVNEGVLLNPGAEELMYRKEGEEATLSFCEDDLREELNGMLMQVLDKHSAQWQKLDAARQAQLAEVMATGKEAIVSAIQNRWEKEKKIILASDIPGILEEAFQKSG